MLITALHHARRILHFRSFKAERAFR
ncbi:hypothetical protein BI49514_00466 [Brevibacterium iodinum ATCC 49514]|uniref:Uncharacterized protein n=1 Tax=Brevibacterium iodinum ATCC 49514 TaxID=1255616 RepID=A0A2H1HX88_9MICO|nr:hypothetical protein BI49514_00466 [Brevibacterium iodinum ATCC 49514]